MAAVLVVRSLTGSVQEAVHEDPVWRARADFIIAIPIEPGTRAATQGVTTEQIWARQLAPDQFEICCIPFFAYDLALGDIVRTDTDHLIRAVVRPSGRYVFRTWFASALVASAIDGQLADMGVLREWSSSQMLAIDAADDAQARSVADFLEARERPGILSYETGRSFRIDPGKASSNPGDGRRPP